MFKHEYAHTLEHVTGAIAKIDTQAKLSTPSPKRSTSPDTSKPIAHPITSKFAKKPISGKPRPKIEKSYREIAVQGGLPCKDPYFSFSQQQCSGVSYLVGWQLPLIHQSNRSSFMCNDTMWGNPPWRGWTV